MPITFSSDDNEANHNLYVTTREPKKIILEEWQKSGKDVNSKAIRAFVNFNRESKFLVWSTNDDIESVPFLPEVNSDFFNKKRDEVKTMPGPFSNIKNEAMILLNESGF